MGANRRRIEAPAKAALAAVRGDRTASQLASQFGVHATQIGQWKRRLLEGAVKRSADGQRRQAEYIRVVTEGWRETYHFRESMKSKKPKKSKCPKGP